MTTARETDKLDTAARQLLEMYQKGQHTSLLNEVDELSKAGPLSPGTYGMAALSCIELERYDEAVKAAGLALQQEPNWAWLYHALAAAEAGQKHLNEAIAAQTRAVRLMPEEPSYAAALARYQREAGRPEQAALTARQALHHDPNHAGALNELGLALLAAGDPAGALRQLRLAQSASPGDPLSWVNEGVLHLRAGALGEARRSFREALKRSPGLPGAEDLMAETLAREPGPFRKTLHHLLNLGRITLVGWMMISFLYYVAFRLLQILWRLIPALLPAAQALLAATLVYLLGGMLLGRLLRLSFRAGWPR